MKLQEWAHWAEITASVAVVVSLVFLTGEVSKNTLALERQAIRDRSVAMNAPYLNDSQIPAIIAKVKAVDGWRPLVHAYVERYSLTYEEAVILVRMLGVVWTGLEADFILDGESQSLKNRVDDLLSNTDDQMYWEYGGGQVSDASFIEYVESLQDSM